MNGDITNWFVVYEKFIWVFNNQTNTGLIIFETSISCNNSVIRFNSVFNVIPFIYIITPVMVKNGDVRYIAYFRFSIGSVIFWSCMRLHWYSHKWHFETSTFKKEYFEELMLNISEFIESDFVFKLYLFIPDIRAQSVLGDDHTLRKYSMVNWVKDCWCDVL